MKYRSRSRLQWVQNALARITVPQNSSFPISSTTALLQHLHRLPVDSRMHQFQTIYNNIQSAGLRLPSISWKSSPQLQPSLNIPPLLNYLQFFHSAHMLFIFLLPPRGTCSHTMSMNVYLLLVFGTISKHTI